MKYLSVMLLIVLFGCESHEQQYHNTAKVYNGMTHVAVPDEDRKHFGFDSIQLLINDKGKIEANFCYPNAWLWAKDTVYTTDTAYRKYVAGFSVTPNAMILFKEGVIKFTNYFDTSIIIDDKFLIKITKVK